MSYLVEYAPESFVDLEKLTPTIRDRIVKKNRLVSR
jgi:mRNA-degrading endonuclease RelE of RelBE toxin-antitoxin system